MPSAAFLRSLSQRVNNNEIKVFIDTFLYKIHSSAVAGKTTATTPKFNHQDPTIERGINNEILATLKVEYPGCKVVYSESFGFTIDWSI